MSVPIQQTLMVQFRAMRLLLLAGVVLAGTLVWGIAPLGTIKVGHLPGPIVVNPSAHTAYVVNTGANSVSTFDTLTFKVKKAIPVGTNPVAIAANPPSNMVYVANLQSGSVSAITGTGKAATWKVGGQPVALVVDTVLGQLYVADQLQNQVEILNAKTGSLIATVSTGTRPTAMAVNIATHAVFVGCTGSTGSVMVIDGTTDKIITTVGGGTIPTGITSISVDPQTNVAVVASPSGNPSIAIAAIDAGDGYSVTDEPSNAGDEPISTSYDPGGLFMLAFYNDTFLPFGIGNGLLTLGDGYSTNELGLTALASNPSTNQLGVVDPAGQTLFIIDLLTPEPQDIHELTTGATPTALAFDPVTSRVFVSNQADDTVSAFDIAPRFVVPAYEGNFSGFGLTYDYIDANPATGTIYTQRLGTLFAINEAQAQKGDSGMAGDSAGVTAISLGSIYSEALAVNTATNKIYVGDSSGLFYSVDGASNVASVISSVPSGADIRSLAVDYASNQIVAWDYGHFSVYVLDGLTEALQHTIPVGSANPGFVLVDPLANLAYAVLDSVYVIDPTSGAVTATIALPAATDYAALNPVDKRLYLASAQNLSVIDTSKNALITNIPVTAAEPEAVAANPLNGNFYLGVNEANGPHVLVYNGSTNKLITDLSGAVFPQLTGATDIKIDPLTNTVYVGSDRGTSTSVMAAIDGTLNTVSAVAPSSFETAAHSLVVDLGTGAVAGAGYSYTDLWLPTSDLLDVVSVPISAAMQGVKDAQTIATAPLYRTHNTRPTFTITATSKFAENAAALVPQHAFCQVDGWQGKWSAVKLKAKNGAITSTGKFKVPVMTTGLHVLYVFASDADVGTIQDGNPNSAAISPIGSVTFTVEK
jgi:YVTN family beta-propeller protein